MRTITVNPKSVARKWYLVDAADKSLGRVASEVARLLMGKHKAIYSPNVDTGDFVVVINAGKVAVTGNKMLKKEYFHHTGHIAGERWINFADLLAKNPTAPLEAAIWGMLPHSALGHKMAKKLKIYAGAEQPHAAQKLETYEIK
ncbi:MAG: 50S ribosomal protein L13 [Fibrobacteraceae bacterium]|nr:50S ribosomal protein L13 [Fibrobacteraceae bacterium]